jgi:hypothetical protein
MEETIGRRRPIPSPFYLDGTAGASIQFSWGVNCVVLPGKWGNGWSLLQAQGLKEALWL